MKTLFDMNKQLVYTDIDYERPLKVIDSFRNGKDAIYEDLEAYAKEELKIEDTALFRLKVIYGNWLKIHIKNGTWGKELFNKVEEGYALNDFKKGFIYEEVILKPKEEIQLLLQHERGRISLKLLPVARVQRRLFHSSR